MRTDQEQLLTAKPPEGIEPRAKRNSSEEPEELRATLGEHLDELRQRILKSLLILTVAWLLGWIIQPWLYGKLNQLVLENVRAVLGSEVPVGEAFRNATEAFMLKLRLSFIIGLTLAFPFIVLQAWGFIKPGLKRREREPIGRVAPFSFLLFALGAFFCWLILPAAIRWFAGFLKDFPNTGLIQEPGAMVFFTLKMMLAFGIGFQLPVVVYALGAMGLLSAQVLAKHWRQAAVAIFFGSAVLTPSADAFSMTMMAVPLVLLFLVSVYAVKLTQSKRAMSDPVEGGSDITHPE